MEEKRYPTFDEEEGLDMCSEPVGAVAYDENAIPIIGPATWEEAMTDLDEAEKEFDAGKGIPWESVVREIRERYHSYAY